MTIYTSYANTDIPARVAFTAGHRGFSGMNHENISTAQKLCKDIIGTRKVSFGTAAALDDNFCESLR